MLRSLALLEEPFQQILLPTNVDLVGCTAAENRERNSLIVLGDVKDVAVRLRLDEIPHHGDFILRQLRRSGSNNCGAQVDLVAPDRDVELVTPLLSGVRRVRFTGVSWESNEPGFAELEVIGRFESTSSNLSRSVGVTTDVSSFLSGWGPERAIDGNVGTSWFTATNDAVNRGGAPYFEVVLAADATVTEIRMFGNRESATGYDFHSGIFTLFDEGGAEDFNSGVVDLPPRIETSL